jgi:hypothetical protein
MSLSPQVCKKNYKVAIPTLGDNCEFWLITVTDESGITNPDKDHAYLTDDGKLFVFNGDSLVRVNCDICFTQEEREKLEGIEEEANKYVLPVASSTELGGVLLGYTQNGRNYPITKDTKGNIYVNVPWEEYQLPKATDNALGGIKTGYKQNGKFYPIKTDTDGNAYVQVPWEDTNTVYEVVSKTSNGLMPMLPSDENASKRFLNGDGEWVVGTDNSINGVTQTGSTFSGETSDCGVQILEVQGKTVQQTTQGYQLFDASKLRTTSAGGATVTNNGDGSFTISGNGNATATLSVAYTYSHAETIKLLKAGKLTIDFGGVSEPRMYFTIKYTNSSGEQNYINKTNASESKFDVEVTQAMLNDSTSYINISFYVESGATIKPATIKPMLYQDGDGTWEPFTGGKPAPNPDYPMPIENVEISNITSHGRQLFDASKLPTKSAGGATVTNNGDGSFTISGSGLLTDNFHSLYTYTHDETLKLLKKGNLHLKGTKSRPSVGFMLVKASGGNYVDQSLKLEDSVSAEITQEMLNDPNSRLQIYFYGRREDTIVSGVVKPMLYQEGDGTWEPFNQANISTSITLAKDDIYQQGIITRDRKRATFDGSSDETWVYDSESLRFVIPIGDSLEYQNKRIPVVCNRGVFKATGVDVGTTFIGDSHKFYYTPSRDITTKEAFKTWLQTHNLVVEYELATPTTEEFKVPTIPSYEPYTEVSTDSEVEPEITFRPLPYTTCLVGEATEEESGYMPPLSGNSNEFLNGSGEWSVPSGYTLPTASSTVLGGVKIGSNISISSGTISIDKENVTNALGYTPPTANTTYEKVDKSSDGLCPKLPNETTTTKYLRQDGAWAVPPNTTYGVASTSSNGLMSSSDKTKLTNLRRIWKGTSSSPPSGWVDGDIYVQYEE